MHIQAGTSIERYEVIGKLGEGGMASVYVVRHTVLGSEHALKVLKINDTSVHRRLLREGQVQARLRHPNVVPVTDVLTVLGQPALVMPMVEGPSLGALLARHAPSLDESLALFRGIVSGVAAAHGRGIIHRDLKPDNVLLEVLDDRVVPRVVDFGLAKPTDLAGTQATRGFVGTPAYSAPEHLQDAGSVDHRADLWSVGCVLYKLLTGKKPYEGSSMWDLMKKMEQGSYASVDSLHPDLPAAWSAIVDQLLQRDPDDRPDSAVTVLAELDRRLGDAPEALRAGGPLHRICAQLHREMVAEREERGDGETQDHWGASAEQPVGSDTFAFDAPAAEGGNSASTFGGFLEPSVPPGQVPSAQAASEPAPSEEAPSEEAPAEASRVSEPPSATTLRPAPEVEAAPAAAQPTGSPRLLGPRLLGIGLAGALLLSAGAAALLYSPESGPTWSQDLLPLSARPVAAGGTQAAAPELGGYRWSPLDDGGTRITRVNALDVPVPWFDPPQLQAAGPRVFASTLLGTDAAYDVSFDLDELGEPREPVAMEWTEEADGRELYRYLDRAGQPLSQAVVTTTEDTVLVEHQTPRGVPLAAGRHRVPVELHEVDEAGRTTQVLFRAEGGEQPLAGRDGSFGLRIARDEQGRPTEVIRLDPEGNPGSSTRHRVTRYTYEGDTTVVESLGAGSVPVPGPESCATIRHTAEGGRVTSACLDVEGAPALFHELGCEVFEVTRAPGELRERCLGTGGALMTGSQGWAEQRHRLDEQGLVVETRRLAPSGDRAADLLGVSVARFERRDDGLLTQAGPHESVEGEPYAPPRVLASWARSLTPEGRETERIALSAAGERSAPAAGWSVRTRTWRDGLPVQVAWFDGEGAPTRALGDPEVPQRVHRQVWDYDAAGNVSTRTFFAPDGAPALTMSGRYHEIRYARDAKGRITGDAVFGLDGEPVLYLEPGGGGPKATGWHARVAERDDLGEIRRMAHFGTDGAPVLTHQGFHIEEKLRDAWGEWVELAYLGVDGEPVTAGNGAATVRRGYALLGGQRRINWQQNEDEHGRLVEVRGACPRNETVEIGPRTFAVRCFSEAGQPYDGGPDGVFEVQETHDELGRLVHARFVDADGVAEPLEVYREWSAGGLMTKVGLVDSDGAPVLHEQTGTAGETFAHDALGRQVTATQFDTAGEPTDGARGYAREVSVYDDRGRLVEERRLLADLETLVQEGQAITRYAYPHDVARVVRKERGQGDTTVDAMVEYLPGEITTLDAAGAPVEVDGIATRIKRYDDLGLVTFEATYDADGALAAGRIPAAIIHTGWDEAGRKVRRWYLDPQEQPLQGPHGCTDERWGLQADGSWGVSCASVEGDEE